MMSLSSPLDAKYRPSIDHRTQLTHAENKFNVTVNNSEQVQCHFKNHNIRYKTLLWSRCQVMANIPLWWRYHVQHTTIIKISCATYHYNQDIMCNTPLWSRYHVQHTTIIKISYATYHYNQDIMWNIPLWSRYHVQHTTMIEKSCATYHYNTISYATHHYDQDCVHQTSTQLSSRYHVQQTTMIKISNSAFDVVAVSRNIKLSTTRIYRDRCLDSSSSTQLNSARLSLLIICIHCNTLTI